MSGTNNIPAHGWTCFHCGETFTTVGSAADHFGANPLAKPGCIEKVELGGERGLLMALRKAQEQIARHMDEDTDIHNAMRRMQSQHSDSLNAAEEAGYARGLRDAMKAEPASSATTIDTQLLDYLEANASVGFSYLTCQINIEVGDDFEGGDSVREVIRRTMERQLEDGELRL